MPGFFAWVNGAAGKHLPLLSVGLGVAQLDGGGCPRAHIRTGTGSLPDAHSTDEDPGCYVCLGYVGVERCSGFSRVSNVPTAIVPGAASVWNHLLGGQEHVHEAGESAMITHKPCRLWNVLLEWLIHH